MNDDRGRRHAVVMPWPGPHPDPIGRRGSCRHQHAGGMHEQSDRSAPAWRARREHDRRPHLGEPRPDSRSRRAHQDVAAHPLAPVRGGGEANRPQHLLPHRSRGRARRMGSGRVVGSTSRASGPVRRRSRLRPVLGGSPALATRPGVPGDGPGAHLAPCLPSCVPRVHFVRFGPRGFRSGHLAGGDAHDSGMRPVNGGTAASLGGPRAVPDAGMHITASRGWLGGAAGQRQRPGRRTRWLV